MNHPRQPARSVTTTVHAMRGRPRGGLVATPDPRTEDEQCLRGLADQFLFRMAARAYSPGSVEAHGWALKYFIDWAVSRRLLTPAAFTRPLLEEYQLFLHRFRSERTGALLAVNTQLARLGVIRRFFAWLCRENIIPANPAADLDLPRKQARLLPKSLAIEEIDRLLALPDVSSPFGARDRALLELFYATGVRRTEMVRLELGDFDVAQRTLHVRRGKGGKSRLLPVGDRAARWLSHYLAEIRPLLAGHPGERALFLSGYGSPFSPAYLGNWVARQMKKAGIEKKGSCHLFRHSCATHMLEGGADIRYIQQMLGHARLDTTQIYTEVSIRALTEAHARSHPHGRLPVSGEGPVDSNGASGSLSPVPEPPIGPVSVLASVIPATTVSHPNEDPEEPTAMEVDSDKPPTDPAVGTFQGMLEACGWPDGTDGGVIEYGYRYLDTQLGRWLSRDPIGERGGVNLYAFVGNKSPRARDYFGMAAGSSYDTRQQAMHDAAAEVYAMTATSVDAGRKEYIPDYSQENFAKLNGMRVNSEISRGNNHVSSFDFVLTEIVTVFGVEHWTFVCCDSKNKWSYDEIKRGSVPSWSDILIGGKYKSGGTGKIPRELLERKAALGCIFVHSHNVVREEMQFGKAVTSKEQSSKLSEADMALAARWGIEVVAVSSDNLVDFIFEELAPLGEIIEE